MKKLMFTLILLPFLYQSSLFPCTEVTSTRYDGRPLKYLFVINQITQHTNFYSLQAIHGAEFTIDSHAFAEQVTPLIGKLPNEVDKLYVTGICPREGSWSKGYNEHSNGLIILCSALKTIQKTNNFSSQWSNIGIECINSFTFDELRNKQDTAYAMDPGLLPYKNNYTQFYTNPQQPQKDTTTTEVNSQNTQKPTPLQVVSSFSPKTYVYGIITGIGLSALMAICLYQFLLRSGSIEPLKML